MIARVFTPRLADGGEKRPQIIPTAIEQRADDSQAVDFGRGLHCGKSHRAGTAKQAMKNGFGLIVGVMGENNAGQCMLGDNAIEQGQPQSAESR